MPKQNALPRSKREKKPNVRNARRRKSPKTAVKSSGRRFVLTAVKNMFLGVIVRYSALRLAGRRYGKPKSRNSGKPSEESITTASAPALSAEKLIGRPTASRSFAPMTAAGRTTIISLWIFTTGSKPLRTLRQSSRELKMEHMPLLETVKSKSKEGVTT